MAWRGLMRLSGPAAAMVATRVADLVSSPRLAGRGGHASHRDHDYRACYVGELRLCAHTREPIHIQPYVAPRHLVRSDGTGATGPVMWGGEDLVPLAAPSGRAKGRVVSCDRAAVIKRWSLIGCPA